MFLKDTILYKLFAAAGIVLRELIFLMAKRCGVTLPAFCGAKNLRCLQPLPLKQSLLMLKIKVRLQDFCHPIIFCHGVRGKSCIPLEVFF